jgi:hypothetical protein
VLGQERPGGLEKPFLSGMGIELEDGLAELVRDGERQAGEDALGVPRGGWDLGGSVAVASDLGSAPADEVAQPLLEDLGVLLVVGLDVEHGSTPPQAF